MVNRNPAAALAGLQVNSDQSYASNEANGRFKHEPGPEGRPHPQGRSMYYDYYKGSLGTNLDRTEKPLWHFGGLHDPGGSAFQRRIPA